MNIISSDHKNEIQFFRNHLLCPWILKLFAEINDSTPLIKGQTRVMLVYFSGLAIMRIITIQRIAMFLKYLSRYIKI